MTRRDAPDGERPPSSGARRVHDVVVVGAGPAGSATALRLARAGLDVALVERGTFADSRVGESLAPAVQPLLRDLGLWDAFLALGPLPSWGTRSTWGDDVPTAHSHVVGPYGRGWHVDRRAVDAMLAESARRAGTDLRAGLLVTRCERSDDRWVVQTAVPRSHGPGPTLHARVVVDATGRSAHVGRMLGARRVILDRLVALAVAVEVPGDPPGHLLVETSPDGWWYSAPVPSGQTVTMLMTDADLSRADRLASTDVWWARLDGTAATSARLAGTRTRSRPQPWPAASHRLLRRDALPWLSVGDAALAVDPVSGSGVLRALRTAAAAADAVETWFAAGGPGPDGRPDPASPLERYEDARDVECSDYLVERAHYYAAEDRWSTPFWRRRKVL
ncbi:NAD(P)/FAD-dependent oxidoreductase [Sanguibacter sp. 25GB23B1]|uniref:NAD(P)/FAD-dependent oxidoreductase n=1 Tax=unclassified Sanguibacter TaxID=2645534 RepID=UPI0032AF906F